MQCKLSWSKNIVNYFCNSSSSTYLTRQGKADFNSNTKHLRCLRVARSPAPRAGAAVALPVHSRRAGKMSGLSGAWQTHLWYHRTCLIKMLHVQDGVHNQSGKTNLKSVGAFPTHSMLAWMNENNHTYFCLVNKHANATILPKIKSFAMAQVCNDRGCFDFPNVPIDVWHRSRNHWNVDQIKRAG